MLKIESPEELIRHINWEQLREQRGDLLTLIPYATNSNESNSIEGIMTLMDRIQNCAAYFLNIPSEIVFGE